MANLLLHFQDYRVDDHRPLAAAALDGKIVYGLVVIDPRWWAVGSFGWARMGARRIAWRLACIRDLRKAYQRLGGDLIVRVGSTEAVVAKIARSLGCNALFGQRPKTDEEWQTVVAIEGSTPELAHTWINNDVLVDVEALPFDTTTFPSSFTKVRRHIEKYVDVPEPVAAPTSIGNPPIDAGEIPSLGDLGLSDLPIDDQSPIATLAAGESGARQQIDQYIWAGEHIGHYKKTRNGMLAWKESSRLSLYLASGCVSPRRALAEIKRFEHERFDNESTYWLFFELLWREYFHHLAVHYGNALFKREGIQRRQVMWRRDQGLFDRWAFGLTGQPFIDASMRELLATGYMSNRGRQVVASYLTKGLGLDWRMGAYWFEHHLIDYDPCVNWGNWQYVAGVGTDPRDRQFSVRKQAQNYDGQAQFVRRWCPELTSLTAAECIGMNCTPGDPWAAASFRTAAANDGPQFHRKRRTRR